MASEFRYRYVDFATAFSGMAGNRQAHAGAESPETLFANELALDVGGTCWGANEPLPILDHHFPRDAQFPSASAAVLHKAALINRRFAAHSGVIWLVTHKAPDFDAFCSMYLARWLMEDPGAPATVQACGLHPDGWIDLPDKPRIDWFSPDLSTVPVEHRWPLLLASYASLLEARCHIACPRQYGLRSVLYAALKRGRDYLNQTSGATEFFDEVRSVMQRQQLNPAFDSVLEGSSRFAPELAMLDNEAEAYQRDLRRARRSTVYLPESEAPTPDFFKNPKQLALQQSPLTPEVDAEHLLLADTFRIATDGIYLRDPECLLFQEWARLDVENSTLGAGFEFTAIAHSNGRPGSPLNKTDYAFSIDPERANGRHLFTVWSRLQTQEVEALRARELEAVAVSVGARPQRGAQEGGVTLGSLLADPWTGGQSRYGNAVGTPQRGTLIGPAGRRGDLRDDPVAEAVRTELEGSIYSAASLVTGPQVTVFDFAGSRQAVDIAPRQFNLNAPLGIPAPPESYFRFAHLRLRSDVPIAAPQLAAQIGETLWQALYPEIPGSVPSDFRERHLVVAGDFVGVWGDRGIAIAQKQDFAAGGHAAGGAVELRKSFSAIVSLVRDVDRFTAGCAFPNERTTMAADSAAASSPNLNLQAWQVTENGGQELARRAAEIKHSLALPDQDLARRFHDALGIEKLLVTLGNLTSTASAYLRRHQEAELAKQSEARNTATARIRQKLEWLEVASLGFLAVLILHMATHEAPYSVNLQRALVTFGAPLVVGLLAWWFKPWRPKPAATPDRMKASTWILFVVALAAALAWLAVNVDVWMK